uniref:Uncharacterized protein n=1 Tax=Brassica campestris TaxID=3711 RepID=A0A3P6AW12_BRACM|nr:unnamed protein product [Brassica rapa]
MSGSMENTLETDMVAMIRRADGHCHEPASVVFSVLSLAMHFHGCLPKTIRQPDGLLSIRMLTSQRRWTTHLQ